MAEKIRLDKWLWAARFYKTRQLAKEAIEGGKVHYNGMRSKVSKQVETNAILNIKQGFYTKTIIVDILSDKRGPATTAKTLYHETDESITKREELASQLKLQHATSERTEKPTKKQRRQIFTFKQQTTD